MKNKKIVLVGGAGFIGHNLAIYLKKLGADVYVIDSLQVNNLGEHTKVSFQNSLHLNFLYERIELLKKYKIPIHVVDARDYNLLTTHLNQINPSVIIHLAAVAHAKKANKDPYSTIDHNMRTLENALDIARDKKVHFIFFSSSMVYGQFSGKAVNENTPCNPLGIYGALKFSGEKLVIAYNQVFNLKYTIVRPSALYGERCVSGRVGQIFIENAIKSKNLESEGDGEDGLDFTYIDDLIQGIEKIINNKSSINQTYNLTYGKSEKIKLLGSLIQSNFPNIKIKFKKRDKLIPLRGTLDIKKAKKEIQYSPKFSLELGMQKYIEWYKSLQITTN